MAYGALLTRCLICFMHDAIYALIAIFDVQRGSL